MFNIGEVRKYLVVCGDAKTYLHLQAIKLDYGEELSWLLPFPGDFHILKNFQPVLSKVYYEVGLKQLAMASGFSDETLTCSEKCTHFKKSHCFMLQSWEVIYTQMVRTFLIKYNSDSVASLIEKLNNHESLPHLYHTMCEQVSEAHDHFTTFVTSMEDKDPIKLMVQYFQLLTGQHKENYYYNI